MHRLINSKSSALGFAIVFMGVATSGCVGLFGPTPLVCDEYPFTITIEPGDDWREKSKTVRTEVDRRWKQHIDHDNGSGERATIGVANWRTQSLVELENKSGEFEGIYVDWDEFPSDNRPAIIDDLLCYSNWRVENIATLTSNPFDSITWTSEYIADEAMDAMQNELYRQTGKTDESGAFIRWRGDFYGANLISLSHSVE